MREGYVAPLSAHPMEQTQHTGERDRVSLLHAFDTRNQPKCNLKRAMSEYARLLGSGDREASSTARFGGPRVRKQASIGSLGRHDDPEPKARELAVRR